MNDTAESANIEKCKKDCPKFYEIVIGNDKDDIHPMFLDGFGINGLGKVIKGIPMPDWNPMELAGNKTIAQTALNVLSTSIDVYQEIRQGCPIQNWIDRLPLLH